MYIGIKRDAIWKASRFLIEFTGSVTWCVSRRAPAGSFRSFSFYPRNVPVNVGARNARENGNIHFISEPTRTSSCIFDRIEWATRDPADKGESARCKKGKILARLFHPVVTVETGAVGVLLDSRSRSLSPTWTSKPSLESNPPSPRRRIARTRVAGEVSPDWRPWTIDQPETSPLF